MEKQYLSQEMIDAMDAWRRAKFNVIALAQKRNDEGHDLGVQENNKYDEATHAYKELNEMVPIPTDAP